MAIKMRTLKNAGSEMCCQCCSQTRENSLELFQIAFGAKKIVLCDACVEILFQKTLRATCIVQSKTKSQSDIRVIQKRSLKNKAMGAQQK